MTVGDLITMLRAYPNDDEIEIQVFETNSGELIDSTSAIGIVEEEAGRKILCKRFSTKSRMALENRADSGLDPLITESHGGQSGMRAGTA